MTNQINDDILTITYLDFRYTILLSVNCLERERDKEMTKE